MNSMGTHKITVTQRHADCIGCGACVMAAPQQWALDPDEGKAVLIGGQMDGDVMKVDIDEADVSANQEAATACPVQIITVVQDGADSTV